MHHKRTLVLRVAVVGALLLIPGALVINFMNPATANATAGTEQEMSFEGKIVNSTGQNIADAAYNMEFRIYTGCTNEPTNSTGCTPVWTEDYLVNNSQGVNFSSGTYQVNLGSICGGFGTSTCENNSNTAVNWNSYPLYLSLQIGNSSNCSANNPGSAAFTADCGGDGVMNPYVLLTSTPYALNSNELGGLTASQFIQAAPTANQTIQPTTNNTGLTIQQTSASSPTADVFDVTGASAGNFIQVTSTAANAGATTVQSLGANALSLQSGGALNVGTSGTESGINIGSVGTTASASTVDIADSTAAGVAQIVDIGSSYTSGDVVTIHAGNQGNALSLQVATNGHVQIGNDQSGTTNDTVDIGDVTGAVASDTSTVNIATYNGSGAQTVTEGSLGGTSTTTIQGGVNSTTPTLLFQAAAGGYIAVGSQTTSTINTINLGSVAVANNDNVNINTNGSVNTGVVTIGGAAQIVGDIILQGSGITDTITGSATAPSDIIKTTTNSTGAFQIQSSAGAADVMDVDTTDGWVGIGITAPTSRLTVPWLSGDTTPTLNVGSSNSSDNQTGLQANSYSSAAVLGTSNTSTGVSGHSTSGSGVYGVSSSGNGVAGQSSTGASGYFQSGSTSDTQGTLVAQAMTGQTADILQIDSSGAPIYFKVAATGLVTAANGISVAAGNVNVGTNGTATSQLYVSGNVPTAAAGSGTGLGGAPWGVKVVGNYAYVTVNSTNTFKVYDVSSPVSPSSVGSVSTTGTGPTALAVQGQYAYVVETSGNKLEVFNISNPTGPTSVGTVTTGNTPNGIYVQGRYAYVVNGGSSNTLQVFDISNPANPVSVGSISTGSVTGPQNVFVQGKYAYVTDASTVGFQVFNVSNPTSPSLTSTYTTGLGKPYGLYVQGKYAYITNNLTGGSGTMQILNIVNPASVSSVKTVTVGDGPTDVYVQGRYAYTVSYTGNTLSTIDVSVPASAAIVGTPLGLGSVSPSSLVVVGRYAYVAENGSTQFQTFDVGGEYSQQLQAGGIETGTLAVDSNATVSGDENLQGGLNVGTAADINGNLSDSGAVLLQDGANSTTAFQIQNSSGNNVLGADTTNGWATLGTSSSINGALLFNNATNTNTAELLSGATTASYTLALPTAGSAAGSCLQSGTGSTTSATLLTFGSCSGGAGYINNQATVQSANLYVQAATSGSVAGVFEANAAGTGDILDLRNGSGTLVGSTSSTGAVKFQNSTDSTSALTVTDSTGINTLSVNTNGDNVTTAGGQLILSGLANVPTPTLTTATSGGTLTANSYYYVVDAKNRNGQVTQATYTSPTHENTTGSTSKNTLTWTAVSNASSYDIYRSLTGTTYGTWDVVNVTSGTTSIIDNGSTYTWTTVGTPNFYNNATGGINLQAGSQINLNGGSGANNAFLAYDTNDNEVILNNGAAAGEDLMQANNFGFMDTTSYDQDFTINQYGNTLFYNNQNATNAFDVEAYNGNRLLAVDTTDNYVGINVGVGGTPSRELDEELNNTTVNSLPVLINQTGTGNAGIQINANGIGYGQGVDTNGNYSIVSATQQSAGTGTILGSNAAGINVEAMTSGVQDGQQAYASKSGTITAINIFVVGVGGSPNNLGQVAIYTDNGSNAPGTLLNHSSSATLTADSWNAITIPSTTITAGSKYWLVFQGNSNSTTFGYNNYGGTYGYTNSAQTFGTWAGTFPANTTGTGLTSSFYASITAASNTDILANPILQLSQSGTASFQNSINSTASFQIQNAAGSALFSADTTDNAVGLGTGTALLLNGPGAYISNPQAQSGGESFGLSSTLGGTDATALGYNSFSYTQGVAVGSQAGADSTGAVAIGYQSSASLASVSIGFQAKDNGFNYSVAVGHGATSVGSDGVAIGNGAQAGADDIALGANAVAAGGNTYLMVIGGPVSYSSQITAISVGSGLSDATPTSNVNIQGTNATAVTTTNTAGTSITLQGGEGTGTGNGGSINFNVAHPGSSGSTDNSEATVATISGVSGSALFENSVNGTTAFKVETSGAVQVLNVNTSATNPQIVIGAGSATEATPSLLVLDNDSTAADPTEVNGALYYNSNTGNFRCGEAGAWENCIGGLMSSNTAASTTINGNTAGAQNFSLAGTIPANYCTAGRVIKVQARGVLSTTTTAQPISFEIRLGGTPTVIGTASQALTPAVSLVSRGWGEDFNIVCNAAPSASSAVEGQGYSYVPGATAAGSDQVGDMGSATTTNFATNGSLAIDVSAIFTGTASASNTITLEQLVITGM